MAGIDLEIVSGNEFMSRHVATRPDIDTYFHDLARQAVAMEYDANGLPPIRQMHNIAVTPVAEGCRTGLDFCIAPSVTLADGSAMLLPRSSMSFLDDMRGINASMHITTEAGSALVAISARNTLISRILALKLQEMGNGRAA